MTTLDEFLRRCIDDCVNGTTDSDPDEECGASRFGDCPLPFGHAGFCIDRDDEAALDAYEAGVTAENPEGSHVDRRTGLLWGERGTA